MPVAAPELVRPSFEWVPPAASTELGHEAVQLAASAGLHLDPWQSYVLERILAEQDDCVPAAFEVGLIVPRQNGKGSVLEALSLAWLFLTDAPLILHSAHEFKTARQAFRRLSSLIRRSPHLMRRVGEENIKTAAGNESITTTDGQELYYVARSKGSGRGFTSGKLILDEAYAIEAAEMAALLPTLATQREAQIIYTSSAGMANSTHLQALRDRGRRGGDPFLCYLEWGGDTLCPDGCQHPLDDDRCSLNDRELWRARNPGVPRRISEEFIRKERHALPAAEFAREQLDVWDEPAGVASAFGPGKWESCAGQRPEGLSPGALAVAVSFDLTHGSIGAAAQDGGLMHLKPLQYGPGTAWLVGRAKQLQDEHGVDVVVDSRGPAAMLIPDLEQAEVRLRITEMADVLDACAGLFDLVQERKVRHGSFPELDVAVAGAVKRTVGDRWAWGRKVSTADISVLEAVTLAAWLVAQHEAPPSDIF